jgi:hypothetical protein
LEAGWEIAGAALTWRSFYVKAGGAAATGVAMSLGALTGWTVLTVGSGVAAGLALGFLAKCVVDTYYMEPVQHQTPLPAILGRRFGVIAA